MRCSVWMYAAVGAALAIGSASAQYFTGDGTAYTLGRSDAGNCNMMNANWDAGDNYAAINDPQWDSLRNCGRCAEVSCADARCADKTTTKIVQILDRCPECKYGDLDLSPTVFSALTGNSPSRYAISWRFVDCPTMTGPIKYCLKGGSNPFWTAIQPTNVVSGVTSLKINGKATTMLGSAYYYLLDGQSATQTDLSSVQVTLTSVNGETIQDTVSLTAGSCTDGHSQFTRGGTPVQAPAPPPAPVPAYVAPTPEPTPAPTPAPTPPPTEAYTPPPTTAAPATPEPTTAAPKEERSMDDATPEPPSNSTSSSSSSSSSNSSNSKASEDRSLDNKAPTPAVEEAGVADIGTATTPTPAGNPAPQVEVVTRGDSGSGGTSPTVIALGVCGAVAAVALVVVATIVRRKKIQDKRNDRDADLALVHYLSATSPRQSNDSLESLSMTL